MLSKKRPNSLWHPQVSSRLTGCPAFHGLTQRDLAHWQPTGKGSNRDRDTADVFAAFAPLHPGRSGLPRPPKGRGSRCEAARAAIRVWGQVREDVLKCTIAPLRIWPKRGPELALLFPLPLPSESFKFLPSSPFSPRPRGSQGASVGPSSFVKCKLRSAPSHHMSSNSAATLDSLPFIKAWRCRPLQDAATSGNASALPLGPSWSPIPVKRARGVHSPRCQPCGGQWHWHVPGQIGDSSGDLYPLEVGHPGLTSESSELTKSNPNRHTIHRQLSLDAKPASA